LAGTSGSRETQVTHGTGSTATRTYVDPTMVVIHEENE
jgi:hypothetical protein